MSTALLATEQSRFGNIMLASLPASGTVYVRTILETLNLTEILLVKNNHYYASDSLGFSETLSVRIPIKRLFIIDNLGANETLARRLTTAKVANDILAFTENSKARFSRARTITESLTLTENLVKSRLFFSVTDTLILSETSVKDLKKNRTVSDNLSLSETLTVPRVLARTVSDALTFLSNIPTTSGNITYNRPEVMLYKKEDLFVLTGVNRAITLPNPEFNDSESNDNTLTLLRSRSGRIYTYINRQATNTLTYSFILTRNKSVELKKFFDSEKTNQIKLQNHKGEIWFVKLDRKSVV